MSGGNKIIVLSLLKPIITIMIIDIEMKKMGNIARLATQTLLLLGVLLYTCSIVYHIIHWSLPNFFGALVRCFLFLFLSMLNFLRIRYTPSAVSIDDEAKILEIKYLALPTKTLGLIDITGYTTTAIRPNNVNKYRGIFIYLLNGKKILLNEINCEDYFPVEEFLYNIGVENKGEERYSDFGYYYRNQLMG